MATTLVTSFFDIGRGSSLVSDVPEYTRDNDKYFEYFKFWARMHNKLIVYTQPEFVDRVMEVRRSFGQEKNTIVVPVEDIYAIEPEIYRRMCEIEEDGRFARIRYDYPAMESKAKYNYVMLMKFFCLSDAAEKYIDTESLAWIDFGFNHGGTFFDNENDFDFLWEPEVAKGIHLYCFHDPMTQSAAVSLISMQVCFQGTVILLTKDYASTLNEYMKEATEALLMLDAMDDDQQLLLMVYKKYSKARPDGEKIFHIHRSTWCMCMKENGGSHLHVRTAPLKKGIRRILSPVKVKLLALRDKILFPFRISKAVKY